LPKGTAPKIAERSIVIDLKGSSSGSPRQYDRLSAGVSPARIEKNPGERARDRVGLHLDARRGHADALPR